MNQEFSLLAIPLERNEQGVIRVSGTRVSLESILYAFYHDGASAEEIVLRFPTCKIEDIYTVLSWALHNPEFATEYLARQTTHRNKREQEIRRDFPQTDLRGRLLARSRRK